jgi:hypothetical protein
MTLPEPRLRCGRRATTESYRHEPSDCPGALVFLMLVAYRGYSVILFAPVAALGAVLLTDLALVAPMFSSVFMEKMQ